MSFGRSHGPSYAKTIDLAFGQMGRTQSTQKGPWMFYCTVYEIKDPNEFVFQIHMSFTYEVPIGKVFVTGTGWKYEDEVRIPTSEFREIVSLPEEERPKRVHQIMQLKVAPLRNKAQSAMELAWCDEAGMYKEAEKDAEDSIRPDIIEYDREEDEAPSYEEGKIPEKYLDGTWEQQGIRWVKKQPPKTD